MQLSDAQEVIEVRGATEANERLAEGWTLLAVVPGAEPNATTYVTYVLGKSSLPVSDF
ncbi:MULTISPECIES: hypothetical protein [unclassified Pseudomonas]|uniref:hypothetical protein n=1 Tax=unclassified Pseudomonas TaxID=196821 RepID=UPI000A4C141E|nr:MULTISPECIES: hypothetical protein [unclassified Pseudomonas]